MQQERTQFLKQHLPLIIEHGWDYFARLPSQSLFRDGARSAIVFLSHDGSAQAASHMKKIKRDKTPTRQLIEEGVCAYLQHQSQWGGIPLLRKTRSWLSVPHRLPLANRLLYHSSHALWKAAGDTSLDGNFYSKRSLLMGVILSSELALLAKDKENHDITPLVRPFVQRRIANVLWLGGCLNNIINMTQFAPRTRN